MNITFLIGNGFDRNLGLNTTYSDFVKYYKKIKPKTENLKKFKNYIDENEELWSAAEIAMGEYTGELAKGQAEAFIECQTDFCENLAEYLKNETLRIDFSKSDERILNAFSHLNNFIQVFPSQERGVLNEIYRKRNHEDITFNFICFNYTLTLDECLNIVNGNTEVLGVHKNGIHILDHKIGQICHVHGTVDKDMVFGVNDDSQITKIEVFDCEDGDLYKNFLVKPQTNATYLENTEAKVNHLLQTSNLIYVFGMSLGKTDKLWWERLCKWLNNSVERHLIVQKIDLPQKSAFSPQYPLAERRAKKDVTKYSEFDENKKSEIESRIHITGENIFSDITNIAQKSLYDKYDTKMEPSNKEKKEMVIV